MMELESSLQTTLNSGESYPKKLRLEKYYFFFINFFMG